MHKQIKLCSDLIWSKQLKFYDRYCPDLFANLALINTDINSQMPIMSFIMSQSFIPIKDNI